MTRPRQHLLWMAIGLVAVVGLAYLLSAQIYVAFLHNPALNSGIFVVLLIGMSYIFWQVLRLYPEIAWIERLKRGDQGTSSDPEPRLLAPMAAMVRERTGEFYRTSAYFSPADGSPLEFEQGQCSCPAGFNCEHAVALILAAADTDAARAASRQAPRSVAWEQSLESLLGSGPAVAASRPSGSVLAIELTLSGDARPAQPRGRPADGPR